MSEDKVKYVVQPTFSALTMHGYGSFEIWDERWLIDGGQSDWHERFDVPPEATEEEVAEIIARVEQRVRELNSEALH